MSERERDSNPTPRLDFADIEALKEFAVSLGRTREADYPQIDADIAPRFYTLSVDPTTIDEYNERLSKDSNLLLIEVQIEYNDSMEEVDGSEIEAAVAINIRSLLRGTGEPLTVREVRYLFVVESDQPPIVQEVSRDYRNDQIGNNVSFDQMSEEEQAASLPPRYRELTQEDVWLLRILIS